MNSNPPFPGSDGPKLVEVACDLCGSREHTELLDRDRDGKTVHTVVCQGCGLVYQTPRPDSESLAALYLSGRFSEDARGLSRPDERKIAASEWKGKERWARLHRTLPRLQPGRSLEIGAGIGSFSALLAGRGFAAEALEPDGPFAACGRELYGIEIAPQLYEDTAEQVDQYRLIAAFHVLEHVESPRAFVSRVARELRIGGVLYLETPCVERPKGGNLEAFFWQAHLYTFSRSTLAALACVAGLVPTASGLDNNALWLMAEKCETSPPVPSLPFEDPGLVISRLADAHRKHQRRQRWPRWARMGYEQAAIAAVALLDEPRQFPKRATRGLLRAVRGRSSKKS